MWGEGGACRRGGGVPGFGGVYLGARGSTSHPNKSPVLMDGCIQLATPHYWLKLWAQTAKGGKAGSTGLWRGGWGKNDG